MIVDIDAGNTRSKWRLSDSDTVIASGASHGGDNELVSQIETAANSASINRVRIASVRGGDSIAQCISRAWSIAPEVAQTQASSCGIKNSYAVPQTMGVDRWCAILAAAQHVGLGSQFADAGKSTPVSDGVCIVDAGSAVTIDFVAASGQHLGGYIAPGFRMQVNALLQGTGKIDLEKQALVETPEPANNTSDAVLSGVLVNMLGLIERSVRAFERDGQRLAIIITGGDAEMLQSRLALQTDHQPDLVLDGIGLLVP